MHFKAKMLKRRTGFYHQKIKQLMYIHRCIYACCFIIFVRLWLQIFAYKLCIMLYTHMSLVYFVVVGSVFFANINPQMNITLWRCDFMIHISGIEILFRRKEAHPDPWYYCPPLLLALRCDALSIHKNNKRFLHPSIHLPKAK